LKSNTGFRGRVTGPSGRWLTVVIWLAAALALNLLLPSIYSEAVGQAPQLGDHRPSVQANALMATEFPEGDGTPALFVWHRRDGLTDDDLGRIRTFIETLTNRPVSHQVSVPPLYLMPPEAMKSALVSEDGSTIVTPVYFAKDGQSEEWKAGVEEAKAEAAALFGADPFAAPVDSPGGLSARVTGPVGIQIDASTLFSRADTTLLLATILLVLVLLLAIYRSPILAVIPLVAVGAALLVFSPILGWMADAGWIEVEHQGIYILTVLLFGAGTDYCLFLISRFRQLLKEERDKGAALRAAFTDSFDAIAVSCFTVAVSLFALLAAEYGSSWRAAVPMGVAILVMGLASLTLVPALLAIMGRASFWPFIPRTPEMLAERAKRRERPAPAAGRPARNLAGSLVVRRPWQIAIGTTCLLAVLAIFAPQIRLNYDTLSSFPETIGSREGFAIIEEQFSPGDLAPMSVIVEAESDASAEAVAQALAAHPGVAQVSGPKAGQTKPELRVYDVRLAVNPYTVEALELVPDIRETAEQALRQSGADGRAWIAGLTSELYDTREATERDIRVIFPLIIALIGTLLIVYLRSLTAAFSLIVTVILSYLSALGLGWLVLHHLLGVDALHGSILLYSFVFLVALGEDYNIFVVSSIWDKSRRMPFRQAIREGVGETGAVITSAGLILAGTFAVLTTMPIQILMQVGVIVALGILLDTFLVRPFLVPAIVLLLGRWAFWPGRRRLPSDTPAAPGAAAD
jgi:RND superfamily putative drug exporter